MAGDTLDSNSSTSRKTPRGTSRAFSSVGAVDIEVPTSWRRTEYATSSVERGNTDGFDTTSSVHSENSIIKHASRSNYRRAAGASYVLAMGICGIVLVALASSLKDLAEMVNRSSIEIGSVFITRGLGDLLGTILSSKLYSWGPGKIIVSVALFLLAGALLSMPLNRTTSELHANFFAVGLLTSVINAGCQVMTCRLHGAAAGPWLGANTVAFGLSGAFAPLIGFLTGALIVEYSILASVTFFIAFFLVVLPRPDRPVGQMEDTFVVIPAEIPAGLRRPISFYDSHKIDFHLAGMMFWFMGGRVAATAFLRQYADETGMQSAPGASLLVVLLWLAITLGRLIGLRDQRTLTLARLYRHLSVVSASAAVLMLILSVFFRADSVLWTTVIGFGVFNGPALGYCYDLSTRISPNPATSQALTVFGLTLGASLVPYLTSAIWYLSGWEIFLPLFLIVSHAAPFFLVVDTRKLHGAVAGSRRRSELADDISSVHSIAAPTPTFGAPPSPISAWSPAGSYVEEETEEEAAERRATEGEGVDIGEISGTGTGEVENG